MYTVNLIMELMFFLDDLVVAADHGLSVEYILDLIIEALFGRLWSIYQISLVIFWDALTWQWVTWVFEVILLLFDIRLS
jgi:hypothetical protein